MDLVDGPDFAVITLVVPVPARYRVPRACGAHLHPGASTRVSRMRGGRATGVPAEVAGHPQTSVPTAVARQDPNPS